MYYDFCSLLYGNYVARQESGVLPKSILHYNDTQKFAQNIDQHLLGSITNNQKNSVFHEGFDSIIRFLNASTFYGLLTPCTNFGVWI